MSNHFHSHFLSRHRRKCLQSLAADRANMARDVSATANTIVIATSDQPPTSANALTFPSQKVPPKC